MSSTLPAARLLRQLENSPARDKFTFCLQVRAWNGSFAWQNAGVLIISPDEIRWVVDQRFERPLGQLLLPMSKWSKEVQHDRPSLVLMLKSSELVSKAMELGSSLTEYPELPGSLEGERPIASIEGMETTTAISDWAFPR